MYDYNDINSDEYTKISQLSFLTLEEVADKLKMKSLHLKKLVQLDAVPHVMMGNTILFLEHEIIFFILKQRGTGVSSEDNVKQVDFSNNS